MITLLKVFSDRGQEEIAELERQVAEEPYAGRGPEGLGGDMVTLVHGPEAYAAVQAASEALFGKGRPRDTRRAHPARRRGRVVAGSGVGGYAGSSSPWWPSGWSSPAMRPGEPSPTGSFIERSKVVDP